MKGTIDLLDVTGEKLYTEGAFIAVGVEDLGEQYSSALMSPAGMNKRKKDKAVREAQLAAHGAGVFVSKKKQRL